MIQYLQKALQGIMIALDWQNNMIVQVVLFSAHLLSQFSSLWVMVGK
jgi:hypothetical protein